MTLYVQYLGCIYSIYIIYIIYIYKLLSCRKYIVCEFSTTPKELGCTDGLVFDHLNNKCVNPEDGPEDW